MNHTTEAAVPAYPNELIVRCVEAMDQSMTAEHARDIFILRDDNGTDLFKITYDNDLDSTESITVQALTSLEACLLPGISGGVRLAVKLLDLLDEAQQVYDVEFYGDMFIDDLGRPREFGLKLA